MGRLRLGKQGFWRGLGIKMEKELDLNSQYNSVEKGTSEILGCFKSETKNRNGESSLYKALLTSVKVYGLQFWCSYVQKNMEK